jgi:hypothetical protein
MASQRLPALLALAITLSETTQDRQPKKPSLIIRRDPDEPVPPPIKTILVNM